MFSQVPRVICSSSSNAGTAGAHGIQARAVATAAIVRPAENLLAPRLLIGGQRPYNFKAESNAQVEKKSTKLDMPATVRTNARGLILLLVGVIPGALIVVGQQGEPMTKKQILVSDWIENAIK